MLDHLHIQNYRLFKDLKIDKLGQVNLIAGKNNTGKTALLEVLRLLASDIEITVLNDIINRRGDWFELSKNDFERGKTLFYNYKSIYNYQEEINGNFIRLNEHEIKMEFFSAHFGAMLGYWIDNGLKEIYYQNYNDSLIPNDKALWVSLRNNHDLDYQLWQSVNAHPEENDLIQILKTIDPRILRLSVNDRKDFIVLLGGQMSPFSLKNLGDGVNRLLSIALALVNAKNNMLIIDEFEVGLHHSVQEQLWDIVFKYAKEWNIQVFVTTHSRDTIQAFTEISQKKEYKGMGNYLRLQRLRNSDEIVAVPYNEENLKTAIEQDIETR